MAAQKPGIPKGTRDFGPEQMLKRTYIMDTIKETFKRFGFQPLETPSMENLSVLTGKYGDEGDQLLFRILNSGDYLSKAKPEDIEKGSKHLSSKICDRGLRYDLTVPFARYVVMNRGTLSFPFKRYQMQPVWRADRPQRGRYREFYQCDADVVGTDSLICEAEIVAMINEVFEKFGISDYNIKINNRKILTGITEAIGEAGKETELCVAIDKLDKIGQEKVNEELIERGFSQEAVEKLQGILQIKGSYEEVLSQLKDTLASSETAMKGVEEMAEVFEYVKAFGKDNKFLDFDVTLARGLSYYTGAIFEVKVNNVSIGSVSGGGRYDNLTGVFGLEGMSGVGFSFGVDRLYDVLEELDLYPNNAMESTKVMFVNFDIESQTFCLPHLQTLRNNEISAEIYPQSAKMKKQMTYANNKGIAYVIMAGSNEIAEGKMTLKNMISGEQELLTIEEVVDRLK
ncbi:histidine--tRNA ligase [Sediminitomix flava]|uniref:Histidine--tRNA ligase n=1 Tax=Sediminitomix flava TaxID=379075 RepID=A0A315ZBF2_SEDFL|nr:histidine--tRNA ligase [Sediminitomix flava]PWJ42393.1 histidyl-tRNA synthetase [Sediminitomix flava]